MPAAFLLLTSALFGLSLGPESRLLLLQLRQSLALCCLLNFGLLAPLFLLGSKPHLDLVLSFGFIFSLSVLALVDGSCLRQVDLEAGVNDFVEALADGDFRLVLLLDRHDALDLALTLLNSLVHAFVVVAHPSDQVLIVLLLADH